MRIRKNLKLYFNTHEKRFIIFACQGFVKQLQLCELVVARAHSLRFKFQDALSDNGSNGADKDVEHFLSALMEKPEVTVIGAGRGPAGRVIHSLFSKQEVCLFVCLFFFFGGGGGLSPFPCDAVLDICSVHRRVFFRSL